MSSAIKELTLLRSTPSPSTLKFTDPPHKKPKILLEQSDLLSLPDELIVEILSRLPAKSLLQYRSISKSFKSIISDPYFIKNHLRKLKPNYLFHRIVLNYHRRSIFSCSISTIIQNSAVGSNIKTTPDSCKLKKRFPYDWIVGSCDGLLCLTRKEESVVILNPFTRVSNKLPLLQFEKKSGSYTVFGFGYDSVHDDYKVVAVYCCETKSGAGIIKQESAVAVFSLKNNCWRRIGSFEYGLPYDSPGKHVDGTINWAVMGEEHSKWVWNIVSFDLSTESFKKVWQPNYGRIGWDKMLGVLDGKLSIFCHYSSVCFDLWVMKEHGVKESWSKIVSIPCVGDLKFMTCTMVYCVTESGEVLLEFDSHLMIYNPKDRTIRLPIIDGKYNWADGETYVETLVSPKAQN